jgi:hypothetical protein
MPVILKNNASSTLATAISASDTGIVVANGSQFPSLGAGDYFYATLVSSGGTTEIIKVTARASNSMTVVRAQDGSSAASFASGALLEMRVNAASVTDLVDEHDQAAEISIADAGNYYTGTNVEAALQEAAQAATTQIADAGGYYAATNVEGALRELGGTRNPKDVATLLADTALTYSNVSAGDIVRTRAEGFAYAVAASGATDHHITTAGGVKLYVQPPYNVRAFGAKGDFVTDDTAAFQAAITAGDIVIPDGNYVLTGSLAPSSARYIQGLGAGYNTPTLLFGAGSYTQCINLPELSTVDGIRIVDNTGSKIGIQINGTYNSVRNCVIEQCDIGLYYFANNAGNSEIKDNFIRNSVTANVKCFRAHNVILTGNRLEYGQYGLWFNTACYDNMVIGNEISHNSVRGIWVDGTSVATKIVGNDFGAHSGVGVYMSKYQDSVIGNHFTDITGNAIYAELNHRSAVISGNTFKNCSPGLAVIQLQSECDNYQITDNIFGRLDIAPVADYCIRVRFGDKVRITGNHFTFGYLTAPIDDFAPQGPVIYSDFVQQAIVTNTDVAAGLASVLTSRPVPASGGYTVAINVGPGRALTCTITNTTGAAINVPELWFYRQPGLATSLRKVIPPQTLAAGASATFVGYAENTTSDQVILIPTGGVIPAGLAFTCGVSDRFRLRENIDSLTGVSGTNGAAPLTLSAFDVTDRSFLVSPSPATGSMLLFSFQRSLNFS